MIPSAVQVKYFEGSVAKFILISVIDFRADILSNEMIRLYSDRLAHYKHVVLSMIEINYLRRCLCVIALMLFLSCNATFSQDTKLLGRVLDSRTQKPLKDVNIIITGTITGTISNYLGYFELTVDTSKFKKLTVSHVGFKTSEVRIPKETSFKFFMERELIVLNEIYVNRYPKNLSTLKQLSSTDEVSKDTSNSGGLKVVESNADFPGGMNNFYTIVGNSLVKHSSQIPDNGFNIMFTVATDGKMMYGGVSDTTIGVVYGEIIRTFNEMPAWIPGTQRGNNVSQDFILPIRKTEPSVSPDTMHDFYEFIGKSIRYPAEARRLGLQGVVYTEMKMDHEGNILSLILLQDIGSGCGDEVIRLLRNLPMNLTKRLAASGAITLVIPIRFNLGLPEEKRPSPVPDSLLLPEVGVTALSVSKEKASFTSYSRGAPKDPGHFKDLKTALNKPNAVRKLSLIKQDYASFPSEILTFQNLEFLDLEKNLLRGLPHDIQNLAKLQKLFLYENKIEILPTGFGNLKQLRTLGIASNQLKEFPLEIMQLEKLEELDLGGNQISVIPTQIDQLKNLRLLVLQNNNIKNLPVELYNLKRLENIFLQGNPIDLKDIQLLKEKFRKANIVF